MHEHFNKRINKLIWSRFFPSGAYISFKLFEKDIYTQKFVNYKTETEIIVLVQVSSVLSVFSFLCAEAVNFPGIWRGGGIFQ